MDQLVELDVFINTGNAEKSSQVFDIGKYISEQLRPTDEEGYPKDQQVSFDQQNLYPPIDIDATPLTTNDGAPSFKA